MHLRALRLKGLPILLRAICNIGKNFPEGKAGTKAVCNGCFVFSGFFLLEIFPHSRFDCRKSCERPPAVLSIKI